MKDHAKAKPTSSADDGDYIVLTPEMALPEKKPLKIINLTHALDEPAPKPSDAPVESDQNKAMEPPVTGTAAPENIEKPTTIEKEVDAAFEAAQSPEPPAAMENDADLLEDDDLLLDELSSLTERVDHAGMEPYAPELTEKDQPEALATLTEPETDITPLSEDDVAVDEKQLAADAEDIEAAMADDPDILQAVALTDESTWDEGTTGTNDQEEEILELDDIVDPTELNDVSEDQVEEESILELTDIVAPAELDPLAAAEPEEVSVERTDMADLAELTSVIGLQSEDEMFEATDIADPVAPEGAAIDQMDDDIEDDIIELTDIVDPDELAMDSGLQEETDTDTTMEIDDSSTLEAVVEDQPDDEVVELTEIVESAELAAVIDQEEDEEIIELTDIVDPAELAELEAIADDQLSSDIDDDIIELTDIVDPSELAADSDFGEDDAIIELTDVVDPETAKPTAASADDADEQVIKLSDILDQKDKDSES